MTADTELRIPPQSQEAELALLGCFLCDPECIDEVTILRNQFYHETHGKAYEAIQELYKSRTPVDAVSFTEELLRRQIFRDATEAGVFSIKVMEAVPHSTHVAHYAAIVREKWLLREGIRVSRSLAEECYRAGCNPDEALTKAVQMLANLDDGTDSDGLVSLQESCSSVLEAIRQRQTVECGDSLTSGFKALDGLLGGFKAGQMIVLAARPGIGKTALANNIASHVMKAGHGVLFVSCEMTHIELTERLLSSETGINGHDITSGRLSAHQMYQLEQVADGFIQDKLYYLDDSYGIAAITSRARLAYRKYGVRFVVADYLQLIDAEYKRGVLREQAVSSVSRELKKLAMELKIPVLVLSQLNRELERRDDKRPKLSDLRESGAIEQDANIVMFLHRPDVFDAEDRPGQAELIIAKNRTGPLGTVPLIWRKEHCRFQSLSMPEIEIELAGVADKWS